MGSCRHPGDQRGTARRRHGRDALWAIEREPQAPQRAHRARYEAGSLELETVHGGLDRMRFVAEMW